jgi:hypothetical protein
VSSKNLIKRRNPDALEPSACIFDGRGCAAIQAGFARPVM